ncbi:MAG: type IIL restriction-modification enzyme MmeI [Candidatus Rifleibacteriota bacterium]
MPLSWNEIKSRAIAFSKEWETETSEDAEAKSFWDGFFNIFGISRKRVASFEEPVKKLGEKQGFIDLFWKGILLVEHKSRGKDLDRAYKQALDYFPGIQERDLPKYILVSDFGRFRLYDLEENEQHEFDLKDLHKNIRLFGFVAGYQKHKIREEDPVNIKAAENMGRLHDQLKEIGYDGHQLELYLVRLLFCLFAEDTGIFERQTFQDYVEERTNEDGSDLAYHIAALFQVLNTPENKRLKNLDEQLAAFPYVNGKLFEELLPNASFDSKMRQTLLDCCALDWSRISPAIFGSLFQSIMDKTARRNLGAHYTSEKNILKLIKPLFLDALWEEFNKVKSNKSKLAEFHQKLRSLKFLDPACGCGNFLVIAYRELRLLELEIIRALHDKRRLAAGWPLLFVDDTPAKILELLKEKEKRKEAGERVGIFTTAIVARREGKEIHLFFTGGKHAGENLGILLDKRDESLEPAMQMTDALSRNFPKNHLTVVTLFLVHARRNFIDCEEAYPDDAMYVISRIALIYKNEKLIKQQEMSDVQRLEYHQKHSRAPMDEIKEFALARLENKDVEKNSPLNQAYRYMIDHWKALTMFLKVPGAPLDNNPAERLIKTAIPHRKNSLFYKTESGAAVCFLQVKTDVQIVIHKNCGNPSVLI